ncbi:MAG: hypothetical protein WDA06_00185 [Phenylobacterium sp.]
MDYVKGRWPVSRELPQELAEYLIIRATGWELDYIRNLEHYEVEKFLKIHHVYSTVKNNEKNQQKNIQF